MTTDKAPEFVLNHMAAPRLPLPAFFRLARSLGLSGVEVRNDLAGNAILDGTSPDEVRRLAEETGVRILSINALQRFNDWTPEREREATALADYAKAAGAEALVLVPVNDPAFVLPEAERLDGLRRALRGLKPILDGRGLVGLVEPLGFPECSLRLKREAVAAIDAVGGADTFRLVHDTFHHVVAGEEDLFPMQTGLVHVSGAEGSTDLAKLRDPDRVLVTADDRLDNVGQVRRLQAGGYAGPLSFEPFAPAVHALADPEPALRRSMARFAQTTASRAA